MPAPTGNELNAAFPEQKVELHRTCVRGLDKLVGPMQPTFNSRFPHNRRVTHRGRFPPGSMTQFASHKPAYEDETDLPTMATRERHR